MSFVYNERQTDSPYAEAVWQTQDKTDGLYLAPADGRWDLTFIQCQGQTKVLLSGPSSRVAPVPYVAGNNNFGIRFKPSAFMPHLPANRMLDITEVLPKASGKSFWFDGKTWEVPTFDNAEAFIEKLANHNLLDSNPVVEATIKGGTPALSTRSVQRHFLQTTGMSPYYLQQINRAHQAMTLLQSGIPIVQVAYQLGYADQPHMTRILKRLTGQTPAQIMSPKDAL